jgi:hypothetical protein
LAGGGEGPAEGLGLLGEAVALAVEAEFRDDEGAVSGDVVEAFEVGAEGGFVFEVEVEGGEVGVFGFEVFGGGVVGVGEEEVWGDLFTEGDEVFEGLADADGADPAGEVCGDFVADVDACEGGVVGDVAEVFGEVDLGGGEEVGLADEVVVLSPVEAGEDGEIVGLGGIEEVAVRHLIEAEGLDAGGGDA